MRPAKRAAFWFTVAAFAASWIAPRWPVEQALHSSLTVGGLAWLVWHDVHWPLRTSHFLLVCAFIVVHSIGARWLYSYVPYDAWLQAAISWSPGEAFGWQRNHFDRFIHLAYGLCLAPPAWHWLRQRWPALGLSRAYAVAVLLIMGTSLVYEWLEWAIALTLSPEAAESYNGQQGDPWDAHADMLLATVGALLAWPLARRERHERVPA